MGGGGVRRAGTGTRCRAGATVTAARLTSAVLRHRACVELLLNIHMLCIYAFMMSICFFQNM